MSSARLVTTEQLQRVASTASAASTAIQYLRAELQMVHERVSMLGARLTVLEGLVQQVVSHLNEER